MERLKLNLISVGQATKDQLNHKFGFLFVEIDHTTIWLQVKQMLEKQLHDNMQAIVSLTGLSPSAASQEVEHALVDVSEVVGAYMQDTEQLLSGGLAGVVMDCEKPFYAQFALTRLMPRRCHFGEFEVGQVWENCMWPGYGATLVITAAGYSELTCVLANKRDLTEPEHSWVAIESITALQMTFGYATKRFPKI